MGQTQILSEEETSMGLGAYSVLRYTDDVGDQRINLGVFVWHPVDGYRCRLSPSLDRVQAIDPRIALTPLRRQIGTIKETLTTSQNRDALDDLCKTFRRGLVVSSPYPARIVSADETVERLYGLVVSPVHEIRRASSQKNFERSLKKTIEVSLAAGWRKARIQQIAHRNIDRIPINIGLRTQLSPSGPCTLWHPLSFQSESRPETHMAVAKSTILDILKTRTVDQYRHDRQIVAVLAPKARAAAMMDDVVTSLRSAADQVLVTNDNDETLMARVQEGLRASDGSKRKGA
jgi:hypothetical protein